MCEPAHFRLNGPSCTLTILVLTNFSIALTSSAALGTSAEPWRAASSEEDCKARFKEEGRVSREGQRRRDREKTREDVNQQEFGTLGWPEDALLGGETKYAHHRNALCVLDVTNCLIKYSCL